MVLRPCGLAVFLFLSCALAAPFLVTVGMAAAPAHDEGRADAHPSRRVVDERRTGSALRLSWGPGAGLGGLVAR